MAINKASNNVNNKSINVFVKLHMMTNNDEHLKVDRKT